jgi:hypothetical protein
MILKRTSVTMGFNHIPAEALCRKDESAMVSMDLLSFFAISGLSRLATRD